MSCSRDSAAKAGTPGVTKLPVTCSSSASSLVALSAPDMPSTHYTHAVIPRERTPTWPERARRKLQTRLLAVVGVDLSLAQNAASSSTERRPSAHTAIAPTALQVRPLRAAPAGGSALGGQPAPRAMAGAPATSVGRQAGAPALPEARAARVGAAARVVPSTAMRCCERSFPAVCRHAKK